MVHQPIGLQVLDQGVEVPYLYQPAQVLSEPRGEWCALVSENVFGYAVPAEEVNSLET